MTEKSGAMREKRPGSRGALVLARALVTVCFLSLLAELGSAQPPTPPSPRGTAAGHYIPLPDRRLFLQRLGPQLRQLYTFVAPPGGNVSITVFPCQGHVSWNITFVGARIFSHPRYPTGKRRKKRCCVTAGVTHNFNFNIAGLNSGLGTSMGDGAITYFLEDTSGGTYYLSLANNSPTMARYEMFATVRPAISPYVQLPNDPQVKVTAILKTELTLAWMPVRGEPWGGADVVYCVEYHRSDERTDDDVRSSTCAAHRFRPPVAGGVGAGVGGSAGGGRAHSEGCVTATSHTLRKLQPGTQYSIDVFARNLRKSTDTAYLSVTASTAGEAVPLRDVARRTATLQPSETRVYTMTPHQRSSMLTGVSPCIGRVKWSVLDSAGRSVQDYRLRQGSPGVQRYAAAFAGGGGAGGGVAAGNWAPPGGGVAGGGVAAGNWAPPGAAARPAVFVNSLPSVDRQYASHMERGAPFSIAVSNLDARRPSSFELYTAVNGHAAGYPRLPADRHVTPGRVTASSISLKWRPALVGTNVTYCVHVFPHNKAVHDRVVHSGCGLDAAERRSVIARGQCSQHLYRTVGGLRRDTWYDVDVVAKNVFTRHNQAYAGLLVFTSSRALGASPGGPPGGPPGAHLFAAPPVRRLTYSSAGRSASVVRQLLAASVLAAVWVCV